MTQFYTYVYIDPSTDTPFYVGKGKGNRSIAFEAKNAAVQNFIKSRGVPLVTGCNAKSEQQAYRFEQLLIALYGRRDTKTGTLLNFTAGGEGGDTSLSPNYIKGMKDRNIAGRNNGMYGKSQSETCKTVNRAMRMGKRLPDATRMKMSVSHLGVKKGPMTDAAKAKMRKPKEKVTCSKCHQVVGGAANLTRWHESNCRKAI